MRITNNLITRDTIANLQRGMQQVQSAQEAVSTGKRFQAASDDPSAAGEVMHASSALRALDQYKRNITTATNRLDAEEPVVSQLTTILERARALAVQGGSDTAGTDTRQNLKSEVDQLLDEAVRIGNSKFGDDYLFGGSRTDVPPFQSSAPPFATTPPAGEHMTEAATSQLVKTNHSGQQVFLDTGALAALKQLSDALDANDVPGVQAAGAALVDAHTKVQGVLAEVGTRQTQMQMASSNLDALQGNLTSFRSDLQDVDLEKAITELVSRQTAFQAAMMATSRVMGMTLTNYLQ